MSHTFAVFFLPLFAIFFFVCATLAGTFLAQRRFLGKPQPMPVVLIHGSLAAIGLGCLLTAYFNEALQGLGTAALVIFLLAALGGFFLFFTNIRGKDLSKPVVILHASLAFTAFILLVAALF